MSAIKLVSVTGCLLVLSAPAIAGGDSAVSLAQAGVPAPGGGNLSLIIQEGSRNYAESDQIGTNNVDTIEQLGSNNSSTVRQNSVGGLVVDIQIGNGNKFTVTQTGIDPPPVVLVQRR